VARLNGRLSALIFTTPMIAAMLNPLLLADVMTRYDDMCYVYVFLTQTTIALVCFGVLHAIASKLNAERVSITYQVDPAETNDLELNQKGLEAIQPFLSTANGQTVNEIGMAAL
jgi:hypothetical protein